MQLLAYITPPLAPGDSTTSLRPMRELRSPQHITNHCRKSRHIDRRRNVQCGFLSNRQLPIAVTDRLWEEEIPDALCGSGLLILSLQAWLVLQLLAMSSIVGLPSFTKMHLAHLYPARAAHSTPKPARRRLVDCSFESCSRRIPVLVAGRCTSTTTTVYPAFLLSECARN